MTTEHPSPTERRLTAALAAAADAVDLGERSPEPAPTPQPALRTLLRTRRGVAAIAVTAMVSGGVGAAAAAATVPQDDGRPISTSAPSTEGAASTAADTVRQIDVDGDGEVDEVAADGANVEVSLSRSGRTEMVTFRRDVRVVGVEAVEGGGVVAVLLGPERRQRLALLRLTPRGIVRPGDETGPVVTLTSLRRDAYVLHVVQR